MIQRMRLHKLTTHFFLVLLLQAWTVSALPVVWCLGSDGHRAIEILTLSDCDSDDVAGPVAKVGVVAGDSCTDFSLALRSDVPKKLEFKFAAKLPNVLARTIERRRDLLRDGKLVEPQLDQRPLQLAQIRTIVLQI